MGCMEKRLRTLDDVPLDGKRVLVRVDFNVPVGNDGVVDDEEDYRIEAALDTIRELQQRRCRVLLLSHRGRPREHQEDADMTPIRHRLADLLGEEVVMLPKLFGSEVESIVTGMEPGAVGLYPNVRLDDREEVASELLGKKIGEVAEAYVNEAFSVCHRAHTSVAVLPRLMVSAAGRRVVLEVEALSRLIGEVERPYVAIVSGSKIDTKVGMLRQLLAQVDTLCVGGQIGNVFVAAQGAWDSHPFSVDEIETAKGLWQDYQDKLLLPVDVVVGDRSGENAQQVAVEAIPSGTSALWDIGSKSAQNIVAVCKTARVVMWNGPVGMFEVPAYAASTQQVAQEVAGLSDVYRVVGGGDTVTALERWRLTSQYDHVSVGGGAMVEFLEGKRMPGLESLFI